MHMSTGLQKSLSFRDALDHIEQILLSRPGIGLVSISGITCSGKTYLARTLERDLDALDLDTTVIHLDDFFRSHNDPDIPKDAHGHPIFDMHSSFHTDEFISAVSALACGRAASIPRYDLSRNERMPGTTVRAEDAVIAEGLFANSFLKRASLEAIAVYVETPLDVCLARRIERDVKRWNVSPDKVIEAWRRKVLPYLNLQRDPEKECADIIVTHS